MITVEPLVGEAMTRALPALARLRIAVFREWPYLYDGSLEHEQGYLARFAGAADALIVAASQDGEIVGVATASPLAAGAPRFAPLFAEHGFDPGKIYYFGESVLRTEFRGQGIGNRFFDAREQHARASGRFSNAAFCGVIRPLDHPLRPPGYRPLDAFWQKRGYRRSEGLVGSFEWKDIDETEESAKPMQFWVREL